MAEMRIGKITTGGADGATVSFKEIEGTGNAVTGAIITGKNISGDAVVVDDLGVISYDKDGVRTFFFRASEEGCDGQCCPEDDCIIMPWDQEGVLSGTIYFPFVMGIANCLTAGDLTANSEGYGITLFSESAGDAGLARFQAFSPSAPDDHLWTILYGGASGGTTDDPGGTIVTSAGDCVNPPIDTITWGAYSVGGCGSSTFPCVAAANPFPPPTTCCNP